MLLNKLLSGVYNPLLAVRLWDQVFFRGAYIKKVNGFEVKEERAKIAFCIGRI